MSLLPTSTNKKINYLNNRDILAEIHKSKISYSYIEDEKFSIPDIILLSEIEINKETVDLAQRNRAKRLSFNAHADAQKQTTEKLRPKDFVVDAQTIPVTDLVFRICTYDHIIDEPGRKRNPKNEKEEKAKLNFPPFKQFVLTHEPDWSSKEPLPLREVVRSHWKGDLETGEFSVNHGKFTNKLGIMILKLVEKYSHRGNWRGYSYVDEMRGQAILGLSSVALQFDEYKSDNPFSYWTSCVYGSFVNVLNMEKNNQRLRDNLLIESGSLPSYGRQLDHEEEIRLARSMVEDSDD
jgi:hypothetical protein